MKLETLIFGHGHLVLLLGVQHCVVIMVEGRTFELGPLAQRAVDPLPVDVLRGMDLQ